MKAIKKEMKQKAKEFTAYEVEDPGSNGERVELKLLRKPIYVYTDKNKNIEFGAVFVFAREENPEILLIFEFVDAKLSCELVRVSGAEVHVVWQGREIWMSDYGDGQPREHKPISYISFKYEDLIQEKL